MQKNLSLMIGGIVVGVVVVGAIVFLVINAMQQGANTSDQQGTGVTPQQTTSEAVGEPLANVQAVTIKNRAYSPAKITIKRGTKVAWTNQDSLEHNVVSDSNAPAGGPPKDAPLLAKDQVFEFTYDTLGTFPYHCTPHPDMKGVIEVVQ